MMREVVIITVDVETLLVQVSDPPARTQLFQDTITRTIIRNYTTYSSAYSNETLLSLSRTSSAWSRVSSNNRFLKRRARLVNSERITTHLNSLLRQTLLDPMQLSCAQSRRRLANH